MKLGNSAGCDGSLILAKEEIQRVENSGLKDIVPRLADIGKKFDVSTADFIQFAGGKYALLLCLITTETDIASSCCENLPSWTNRSNLRWTQRQQQTESRELAS
jgi:hypothetical protein